MQKRDTKKDHIDLSKIGKMGMSYNDCLYKLIKEESIVVYDPKGNYILEGSR